VLNDWRNPQEFWGISDISEGCLVFCGRQGRLFMPRTHGNMAIGQYGNIFRRQWRTSTTPSRSNYILAADQKAARPRSTSAETEAEAATAAVAVAEAALVHANLIAPKSNKKINKTRDRKNVGGVLHHARWPKKAKGVDVSHGYAAKRYRYRYIRSCLCAQRPI